VIVTCNVEYWQFMQKLMPEGAPCGKTYDDEENFTICPHESLPPKLTLEQQKSIIEMIRRGVGFS